MWIVSLSPLFTHTIACTDTHTVHLTGWRPAGRFLWLRALANHPSCGQSHHTQKRWRLLLHRRCVLISQTFPPPLQHWFTVVVVLHPHLQIPFCCLLPLSGQSSGGQTQERGRVDGQLAEPGPRGCGQRLQCVKGYANRSPAHQPSSIYQRKGEMLS